MLCWNEGRAPSYEATSAFIGGGAVTPQKNHPEAMPWNTAQVATAAVAEIRMHTTARMPSHTAPRGQWARCRVPYATRVSQSCMATRQTVEAAPVQSVGHKLPLCQNISVVNSVPALGPTRKPPRSPHELLRTGPKNTQVETSSFTGVDLLPDRANRVRPTQHRQSMQSIRATIQGV